MMACPEIEELVSRPPSPAIAVHCRECAACDALLALAELRELGDTREAAEGESAEACILAEIAIAEAVAGSNGARALGESHLEHCHGCSETAVRAIAFGPIQSAETTRLVDVPSEPVWRTRWQRAARTPRALIAATLISAVSAVALGAIALMAVAGNNEAAPTAAAPEPPGQPAAGSRYPDPTAKPTSDLEVQASPAQQELSARTQGFISITCEPECNDVVVDDEKLGKSPILHHRVRAGIHRVLLRSGTHLKARKVVVVADQEYVLRVRMTEQDEPSQPITEGFGFLTVVCDPTCDRVQAGKDNLGTSPVVRATLKTGVHNLTLQRGSVVKRISVRIVAGQTTARRVKMQ